MRTVAFSKIFEWWFEIAFREFAWELVTLERQIKGLGDRDRERERARASETGWARELMEWRGCRYNYLLEIAAGLCYHNRCPPPPTP